MYACARMCVCLCACVPVCLSVCLYAYHKGLAGVGINFFSLMPTSQGKAGGFPYRIISLVQEGPAANSGLLSPEDEVVSCLCSPLAILLSLCVHYTHTPYSEMQKSEGKQLSGSIVVEDGFDVSHGCILVHTHHQAYCRLGPYFL
jgi:hypothetical protein